MSSSSPSNDLVWFSHVVNEYEIIQVANAKKFAYTDRIVKMDWDNCTVDFAKVLPNGIVRFVIRSRTNRNSDYMGSIPVQLRFMIEVDIEAKKFSEPYLEKGYTLAASKRKHLPESAKRIVHDRWVFALGDKAEVWEWTRPDLDIRSSRLYRLHQEIRKQLETPHQTDNIFQVDNEKLDDVVPVVYQPAVDSLDNFLREMHCMKVLNSDGSVDVEVSLLFNNEQLRKFRLADGFYRWLRKLLYGRLIDVETFRIHFVKDDPKSNYFIFEGIYSGDYNLEYDTIHLDNPPSLHRNIEYYFDDRYHPVVFINTSNHAMGAHDNNHDLWKWEYVAWAEEAPIVRGTKSRKEIEKSYKPLFSRIFG
jgi:hypothetical protein